MSARKPRLVRSDAPRRQEDAGVRPNQADFSDNDSQDALDKMACAVARELGRQAARAWWERRL